MKALGKTSWSFTICLLGLSTALGMYNCSRKSKRLPHCILCKVIYLFSLKVWLKSIQYLEKPVKLHFLELSFYVQSTFIWNFGLCSVCNKFCNYHTQFGIRHSYKDYVLSLRPSQNSTEMIITNIYLFYYNNALRLAVLLRNYSFFPRFRPSATWFLIRFITIISFV